MSTTAAEWTISQLHVRACSWAVFLVSAAGKLLGGQALRAFAASLVQLRLVRPAAAVPVAAGVAAAETAAALLLAVPATRHAGFALAAGLMALLTGGVGVVLARGTTAPCRCFGASVTPLAGRHLYRNVALTAVAGLGLLAPAGNPTSLAGLVALLTGLVTGLLVTAMDDLVELFTPAFTPAQRRSERVSRRSRGPVRTTDLPQRGPDRRRHPPVA